MSAPHPLGALAYLASIPQWIVARRADKVPVDRAGQPANAQAPINWRTYDEAAAEVARMGPGFGLGFVLTLAAGLILIDIDNCLMPGGAWSPLALELCAALPGAVVEVSQSGRGLHIWCRHPAPPDHACKDTSLRIEAYSADRYIMLGQPGAVGTLADRCDALPAFLARYFPPRVEAATELPEAGPVPEWKGPPDTDEGNAELIRRALASRSPNAVFGSGVSFADLWTGNVDALARAYPPSNGHRGDGRAYDASSADAALFLALAFWTGKDQGRMGRLAEQSALKRDKWERADYIARTVQNACKACRDVLGTRQAVEVQQLALQGPGGPLVAPTATGAAAAEMPAADGTEDSLALQFVDQFGPLYRWSPGQGWMTWAAPVWERDAGLTRYDLARKLCRAAAWTVNTQAEQRRLTAAKSVQAVLTHAQADRRVVVPDSAWDADPMVLNTPAGLIDLRTGAACDPGAHLATQCTAVAPDFQALAPTFLSFLGAVFQGDAELCAFVQRMVGYLLTGTTREQVLFFLYGSGANGKSTLVDLLLWLIGTYALKLPASTLMTSRSGEQHPTGIAQLRGKRVAVSSELEEGQFFNESLVKELTGDATLTARFMRGDFFSFSLTQKHIIVGNFKPRLRGGDPALARRMVLVPFDATFGAAQRDPDMLHKLKAEGPAVLAWAIRGALEWHARGLGIPDRVRAASADYMAAHDDLQLWMDERCERVGESKASDLYADFRQWKERRGEHAPTQTTWGERLQRVAGIAKRKSNGVRYSPVSVKPFTGGTA